MACGARLFDTMSKMPAFDQIVVKGGVEDVLEHRCLGIAAHRLEVRRGQPNAL